jgi:hypothetical protein
MSGGFCARKCRYRAALESQCTNVFSLKGANDIRLAKCSRECFTLGCERSDRSALAPLRKTQIGISISRCPRYLARAVQPFSRWV